jgi:hypothetical protein
MTKPASCLLNVANELLYPDLWAGNKACNPPKSFALNTAVSFLQLLITLMILLVGYEFKPKN